MSASGTPVIVNSSDAVELEGLCDKVMVMSRGRVVETLTGDEVREERIVSAAVSAATHDDHAEGGTGGGAGAEKRLAASGADGQRAGRAASGGDRSAGAFGYSQNAHFLSPFNLSNILLLATALGFIALGQTVPLMLGAIDLSVGPLMGLGVVIASFFIQ